MERIPIVMAWSGGKDSALALYRLQQDARYEVRGLLTTVTEGYDRISMHGVRDALLSAQGDALGLPVYRVWIPPKCSNVAYEAAMESAISELKMSGVKAVGFGDLFLQDIRRYRESMLAPTGLTPVFPIWGADTHALARNVVTMGFGVTLCCVDPKALAPEFVGRAYDHALLDALPANVDPCGENGEFHTFVHAAPNFRAPIPITVGERIEREGFWFCDLTTV